MKNLFNCLTGWVTLNKDVGRKLKTMKLITAGTDGELPNGFVAPFSLTPNYIEMNFKGHQYFNSNESISDDELAEIKKSFFNFIAS